MTPEQRRERARKAANSRWSRPTASAEQSEMISKAIWTRWETLVDPEESLPWEERHRLAERALKAHMAGMRLARANNQAKRPARPMPPVPDVDLA